MKWGGSRWQWVLKRRRDGDAQTLTRVTCVESIGLICSIGLSLLGQRPAIGICR